MSLYRLQRYAEGNGDPIDTSDALAILSEVDRGLIANFNKGIDAAIKVVDQHMDYESRMVGTRDALVKALESSKI